jgi:hypothetical protein
MRFRFAVIVSLLFLMSGCSGSSQPKPDWGAAPGVDIPAFTTFGWVSEISGSPNTILETQISNALRSEFLKKGYVETSDAPDFLVRYETVELESTKQSNPVSIGIGVGSWGSNVGGSVGTSVGVGGKEKVLYQNRLTVRALDPETSQEVWIGITTTFEQRPNVAEIDRVVAGVMKGFPDKRR